MIRIVFLVVMAMGAWAIYMIWRSFKHNRNNPHKRLQKIIEDETEKLHRATEILAASEKFVRQRQREVGVRQTDVDHLLSVIKKLVKDGKEDQARVYINTLTHKEQDLAASKNKCQEAIDQHGKSVEILNSYSAMLKKLKQEASELEFRVNLSQAEKEAAALGADLESQLDISGYKHAKEEIESVIRTQKAEAEIDNHLRDSAEKQFLEASSTEDIEKRLEQYKAEMQESQTMKIKD
jgi:phage shock protein A